MTVTKASNVPCRVCRENMLYYATEGVFLHFIHTHREDRIGVHHDRWRENKWQGINARLRQLLIHLFRKNNLLTHLAASERHTQIFTLFSTTRHAWMQGSTGLLAAPAAPATHGVDSARDRVIWSASARRAASRDHTHASTPDDDG